MHHRGGLRGHQTTVHPRRSARHRFHRRAGARRRAEAAAGHRRRHHRPGDGHRVCLARREALGGRAHRRSSCRAPIRISCGRSRSASRRATNRSCSTPRSPAARAKPEGLAVEFEDANGKRTDVFDRVLVAVGRSANGKRIGPRETRTSRSAIAGVIPVDKQMRTNLPHVFAIGDLVPGPMLAHKAMHEAKVAAEVAAGHKSYFDARVIPSVAYTDPEVAWVGPHRNRREEERHALQEGPVPVGGQRPFAGAGPRRRLHQTTVRSGHASRAGRRHGGSECRRAGRRGGAGHRDGCGCRRHRPHDPPASDVVGDGGVVGRGVRRNASPISTCRRRRS